jgi:hypothetical protein
MSLHLVVHQHEGGFFSNFNKVVSFLEAHPEVSKITWDLQGQSFGAFAYGCGEVFSKLFVSYDTSPCLTTHQLTEYVDQRHTGRNTHGLYLGPDNWRAQLHRAYIQYIKPTPYLGSRIEQVDDIFNQLKERPKIGILKRNELLKCEQQKNCMPSFEQYQVAISQLKLKDPVYVFSVDSLYDIDQFKVNYKPHVYSPIIRRTHKNTDMEPHFLPGTELDAATIFLDVYMLSLCDYFIHPVSNMATAALYMNPLVKSIYLY